MCIYTRFFLYMTPNDMNLPMRHAAEGYNSHTLSQVCSNNHDFMKLLKDGRSRLSPRNGVEGERCTTSTGVQSGQ